MHFEEFLGIRDLTIDSNGKSIAIVGPNGSGKSGLVEGLVFGLTGRIMKFEGTGSKKLTTEKYGPNIAKKESPKDSFVELNVYLTNIRKSVKITRKISEADKPFIKPENEKILSELDKLNKHAGIALTRKNMLQFILIEPGKRAQQVQALLGLENLDTIRRSIRTTKSELSNESKSAEYTYKTQLEELIRHFEIEEYNESIFLKIINEKCKILNLSEILEFSENSILNIELDENQKSSALNKESAIRELESAVEFVKSVSNLCSDEKSKILEVISELENDRTLLKLYTSHSWLTKGIEYVIDMHCPLCDTEFDSQEILIEHLRKKQNKSQRAAKLYDIANTNGIIMISELEKLLHYLEQIIQITKIAENEKLESIIEEWTKDLTDIKTQLTNFSEIVSLKERLLENWIKVPTDFIQILEALVNQVKKIPDQNNKDEARSFLLKAKSLFKSYFESKKKYDKATLLLEQATYLYKLYCEALDDKLNTLYETVKDDFCEFYKFVNDEDEDKFTAEFNPKSGSLDLEVDFYNKGLFHPGAYHSEGHQDMMGLCLFLALVKQVNLDNPSLIILDDVLMSVDIEHRRKVSKMLKKFFGNTQFIITTHDPIWENQMHIEKLVKGEDSYKFYGWTVESGTLTKFKGDIWKQICEKLKNSEVEPAAQMLRRYLEGLFLNFVKDYKIPIVYRHNGLYTFGELFQCVPKKLKELYKEALTAAESWENEKQIEIVNARIENLDQIVTNCDKEQWPINKAIHYNDWANFTESELKYVISAFKELLDCFKCESCDSWLQYTSNSKRQSSLRCDCNKINLNLKTKKGIIE